MWNHAKAHALQPTGTHTAQSFNLIHVDVFDDFLVAESEVVVELGVSGEEGVEVEGEVLVFFEVVEAGEEVQVVRVVEKLQGDVWLVVD